MRPPPSGRRGLAARVSLLADVVGRRRGEAGGRHDAGRPGDGRAQPEEGHVVAEAAALVGRVQRGGQHRQRHAVAAAHIDAAHGYAKPRRGHVLAATVNKTLPDNITSTSPATA